MPSRKQRRRRQKSRRHEYEYVYVDEEGREVDPDEVAVDDRPARGPKDRGGSDRSGKDRPAKKRGTAAAARGRRGTEPPSWRRAVKRGLIFAPFMFLTLTLLASDLSVNARLFQTAYLLVMFIPFTYFFDRLMYRRSLKNRGGGREAPSRR